MNIFKAAYKVKRENSDDIYKGFGFKHLSDATQYYVHPNNQSYKGTTTLCQPIGEALSLLSLLLQTLTTGNGSVTGDIYASDYAESVYLEVHPSDDWRSEGVIEEQIYSFRAYAAENRVVFGAYDRYGDLCEGDMEHIHPLYKLLPCFAVLLAREMQSNNEMKMALLYHIKHPGADTFVNIHEDFYQNHKNDEYELIYEDISDFDTTDYTSFKHSYAVIKDNLGAYRQHVFASAIKFDEDDFDSDSRSLIPALSDEFVLPAMLKSLCSAIAAGDVLATLLHGPAGSGKTISCKLICQAAGLPIMDTVNCTENLDEFVLGKYIPEEDRILFKESYVTRAIRSGGAVVFEEINFAKPQYLAFLNSLLDDNGFVRLDNGEMVRRHPNFRFFATMNLGYFGTKELNQALYNRFNAVIEVAELSDESIRRMLLARVPECESMIEKMLGVYHKLKKKIESEELDVVISPRNLENWARLAKYDGYIRAAEKTILPIAKCDRVLEESIRGIIVLHKWAAR